MPLSVSRPVRDVARRAVQAELVAVAQRLFEERGYAATTVDAIAEAAGMSRRTFFRYFESKDELVLGKYDLLGEQLLENFRARPESEPLWTSLQRMFETASDDAGPQPPVHPIERIVEESASLRAGYLFRLETIQKGLAEAARERAARNRQPYTADDPTPEALVGAAFACITAARAAASHSDASWSSIVDRAMQVVHPPV
jgi:AcrR family transcriptional regulator